MSLRDALPQLRGNEQSTLETAGVETLAALRSATSTPAARTALAAATGIESARILQLANWADLMRVPGIDAATAVALEAAGVDSVLELARRRADNLSDALEAEGVTVDEAAVARWMRGAGYLGRGVWHEKPAAIESQRLALRRRVYGGEFAALDRHFLHGVLLELQGQALDVKLPVREAIADEADLPDGALLEVDHLYASGDEAKLASLVCTIVPGMGEEEGEVRRLHLRLPKARLPDGAEKYDWVQLVREEDRVRYSSFYFGQLVDRMDSEELGWLDLWLDLEVESAAAGDVVHTQWGSRIVREVEEEVRLDSLPEGTQLYVIKHPTADAPPRAVPLAQRLRIGKISIKPVVLVEREDLPEQLRDATSTELRSSGATEYVARIEADGSLNLVAPDTSSPPLPEASRVENRRSSSDGTLTEEDRVRLMTALTSGPTPPELRSSAAHRGSVTIHWHYWEATGIRDGKEIWKCVVINDETITCEFQTKEKTAEQTTLEGEVEALKAEKTLKEGEFENVEGQLTDLQAEINHYAAKVGEEEDAAEAKETEAAEADEQVETKTSARDAEQSELEALGEEQLDAEAEFSETESYLEWIDYETEDIDDESYSILDEMNANDDELGTIESDLETANSEHGSAQAKLEELAGRYSVAIIDRETWGAQEPGDDDNWYDYPSTTPLKDQLDSIVVHHTADPQDQTVQELEEKERDAGYSDMPYHFVITKDGSIYEGREIGSMGAHAGIGLSPGVDNDPDKGKIGIVLTGDMERDINTWIPDSPTDAQLSSLKALSGYLCREYNIDASDILKHSEVPDRGGNPTVCPGQNLAPKVEEIRDELGTELPTYDEDLRAAHDSVNDLESKIDDLEGRQRELDERNQEIRNRLDDLSSRRDDLIGERDAHQASKDELESAMEDRAGKIGDLQSEIDELSGEIESLEATRDAARSEGEAHRQNARDHQAEVDSRVEERTSLRKQRDALQSRIDELDGEIDAKQSRIEELDAEVGEAWGIGDEQTQAIYELIFDVTFEDPWTLVSEELKDGKWTVGKLKANPNEDCEVCGAHIGEEYPFDEPGAPYHPNCDCAEEQVLQDVSAR